jgi:hypothetical protein
MDSWTPAQIEIMKAGGNDKCNEYIFSRGVPRNASIREKYSSDAAALYKQVLKARAEKRPEPTELSVATSSSSRSQNTAKDVGKTSGQDPNGMERLRGETDAEYIARQTRLREEAKKRMAQKFGNMDSNGKRVMGGIGSSPHPSSSVPGSSSSSSFLDVSSFTNSFSSGLGTAASGLSSVFSLASNTVNSSGAREVAKDVGSMGLELWSTLSSSAKEVANNLNMEGLHLGGGGGQMGNNDHHQAVGSGAVDGLSALNEKMKMEKLARGNSSRTYTGFGSDSVVSGRVSGIGGGSDGKNGNGNSGGSASSIASVAGSSSHGSSSSSIAMMKTADPNSVAPLPGESDSEYMARQMKIRKEAQAKSMANKVVKTALPKTSSSTTTAQEPKKALSTAQKLQVGSDDDFFASFGA